MARYALALGLFILAASQAQGDFNSPISPSNPASPLWPMKAAEPSAPLSPLVSLTAGLMLLLAVIAFVYFCPKEDRSSWMAIVLGALMAIFAVALTIWGFWHI